MKAHDVMSTRRSQITIEYEPYLLWILVSKSTTYYTQQRFQCRNRENKIKLKKQKKLLCS